MNIDDEDEPIMFSQVMIENKFIFYYNTMKDEFDSMANNQVQNLVELLIKGKTTSFNWVFKTKIHFLGNIERYKTRFEAKGFTPKEEIDYHDTFFSISNNDSFQIIMALVSYFFYMELH